MPTAARPVLLNFNENALGMSPLARAAVIDSLGLASRYPDDQRAALITELAALHGQKDANISLGNGSSENIQAIVQSCALDALKAGKAFQVVMPDPTFNYAELYALSSNLTVKKVAIRDDMVADLAALRAACDSFDGLSLVYLCNPNNPTATIVKGSELEQWIMAASDNTFFLLDEAYAEFVHDPQYVSGLRWISAGRKNLAVTRTFSKMYGLAGLRVGYAISHPDNIAKFEAFMSLDNTNLAGAVAASASLKDKAYQQRSIAAIDESRRITMQALDELGLKYAPSHANFIFHEVRGQTVKAYRDLLREKHFIKVGRDFPPVEGWSRLTLGTPEEMTYFVKVLKQVMK